MELTMAKKKVEAKVEQRVRTAVIAVRSMPEWKAVVEEAAEFDRAPSVVDFIDRAIAHYCREINFKKPLPKR